MQHKGEETMLTEEQRQKIVHWLMSNSGYGLSDIIDEKKAIEKLTEIEEKEHQVDLIQLIELQAKVTSYIKPGVEVNGEKRIQASDEGNR